MDESGGSGQPRSGTDESAQHHAGPAAPATDPALGEPTDRDTRTPDRPDDAPARKTDASRRAPAPQDREPEATDQTDEQTPEADDAAHPGTPRRETDPTGPLTDEPARSEATTPGQPSAAAVSDVPAVGAGSDQPAADSAPGQPSAGASPGHVGDIAPGQSRDVDGGDGRSGRAASGEVSDSATGSGTSSTGERAGSGDGGQGSRAGDTPSALPPAAADPHADRPFAQSGVVKGRRPPQRPKEPGGGLLMGRPFGVPVYVAPSWFLVAALITWVFGGQLERVLPELGVARYLVSLFFAVAFYASVLVHELAHTVAALRFKLPVRRIQLQFFGGVSEIEKEAETPGREFVLAFVGPLLSLVLAGLFYLALQPVEPGTVPGVLLAGLMISNLIVAAFNLLPGLPLDGGRMLRAVVWKITGKPMSGTIAAAWVGRALAVSVLIGLPLLTQSGALGSNAEDNVGMDTVMDALLAAILAAIIWTGAGNSLRMARLREHLPELRARNLTRRAVPVETDTPLSEALRRANEAGARALVVVDADGEPLSLVREAAIVGVPEHRRPWVAVSGLAQDLTDGMRVSAELAGEDLLDALRATPATEYLVVEDTGEIYGVLSAADVERAFVKAMARPS
ncbi:site-2 protease family protein [Streptomyces sp. S.PB5]|uniref:site-2 protease family protein n=1 Tax=Streptomyces sp. S.PB5 TaxID=3020844 RepID=UPI0025AF610F|nr:site-2 protease family protein [Streptomyces sp. S.PB5]MDN3022195.1 site-2 protease family protein [Streptomyces sp. S.PB5]